MTPAYVLRHTNPAALALLPTRMDSPEARAMLVTIGLQESTFTHRVQVGGPARGYWQFEEFGGVRGVLQHEDTKGYAGSVCDALSYPVTVSAVYHAVAHNDVLACAFARLLLWTLPEILPDRNNATLGWYQYNRAWRPGKPHPETWAGYWSTAWNLVNTEGK